MELFRSSQADDKFFLGVFLCVLVSLGNIRTLGALAGPGRPPQASVDLASFGARPNDPRSNSRAAFQSALEKLRTQGGGTLSIPPGDYYLDFSDVASDLDPHDARSTSQMRDKDLRKEKLILVPPRVMLQGALDRDGKLATRIHWKATSFPLLGFVNSDGSGAVNLAFVFDGEQPQFFPWSQENFLEAVGYKCRWLGGPHELSAVIYTIGSSNLRFENLTFQSGKQPADNEHTFAFGIVSKGRGPVPQPDSNAVKGLPPGGKIPGGGLSECVSNNVFRGLRFRDYVMGILASGQCNATLENIEGHERGSWYRSMDPSHEAGAEIKNIGPPGHLIYLTFQNAYDVERTQDAPGGRMSFHSNIRNKGVTVRSIKEGPETLSNFNSLGTLSLKDMDGGLVADVESHHPIGLIQSMVDAHDVQLENLTWSTEHEICDDARRPSGCGAPVITLEPSPPDSGSPFNSGVKFRNVRLQSPHRAVMFKISQESASGEMSQNISVDGLTIETSPMFGPNQGSPQPIIAVRSVGTHLTNVHFIPALEGGEPPDKQNFPAVIQSRSRETSVEISIEGERGRGRGRDHENRADSFKCVVEDQRNPGSGTDNKCQIVDRAKEK